MKGEGMQFSKAEKLYEGKAKVVFQVQEDRELVWLEYKNSLTAFNAQKKGSFVGKGLLNCQIATLLFHYLKNFRILSSFKIAIITIVRVIDIIVWKI